jgi:anti-sigma factor (TIGR02949 family)
MEIFARLSEYLDGELPEDLCERIEGHMDGCAPCQDFLKSLEKTVRLIETSEAPAMPGDLRRAVLDAWKECD